MISIKVRLPKHPYNIFIGNKITKFLGKHIHALNLGTSAYIITNSLVKDKYSSLLKNVLVESGFELNFKVIPDTEKSKSIAYAASILEDLAAFDKKKKVFIIAFGGGVVGDLAGFVASVYKRGIPYIQVPTTLLAQVDSSIGGKTAVDLAEGKNLIGAYYQPRMVSSDLAFLMSLDKRQVRSGLAEVIKYGLIKDRELFIYLEKNYRHILALKSHSLSYIIERSSRIKAEIVGQDEKEEKMIRTILNFGHTLGHAIEAAGKFTAYNHGEAIAIGMLCACDISRKLNFITEGLVRRIERLVAAVGLPVEIRGIALSGIIKAYHYDKKFLGKQNRLVLLQRIGKAEVKTDIPFSIIKEVLEQRIV